MHEAQKAYHYGFDEHKSLQSLTSVPAKSLKLDHRIGSIEIGKDADLVIWERHPLRLGARPKHVIIDGAQLNFDVSWTKTVTEQDLVLKQLMKAETTKEFEHEKDRHYLPPFSENTMHLEDHGLDNPGSFRDACSSDVGSFVLRNITQIYMNSSDTMDAKVYGQGLYMVVKDGQISCLGVECDRDHIEWPVSSPIFEMGGAVVIPVRNEICHHNRTSIYIFFRALYLWVYHLVYPKFKQKRLLKMVMLKMIFLILIFIKRLFVPWTELN